MVHGGLEVGKMEEAAGLERTDGRTGGRTGWQWTRGAKDPCFNKSKNRRMTGSGTNVSAGHRSTTQQNNVFLQPRVISIAAVFEFLHLQFDISQGTDATAARVHGFCFFALM